jgi:hypothetical protein
MVAKNHLGGGNVSKLLRAVVAMPAADQEHGGQQACR